MSGETRREIPAGLGVHMQGELGRIWPRRAYRQGRNLEGYILEMKVNHFCNVKVRREKGLKQ